ncbi:hypothetical protein L6452_36888 [Arctium lappa]|uniref:Uncharacterized protein n=1 Tax=Arctium lappa TaxID=4217 RepID=A0ACB8Y274_ARCLA|nr:hypothetical protein L6452_36888 [Arctium lappa]
MSYCETVRPPTNSPILHRETTDQSISNSPLPVDHRPRLMKVEKSGNDLFHGTKMKNKNFILCLSWPNLPNPFPPNIS